jgi:hypothetical protein
MNAKTVYDVAKALPQVEQLALFNMLQKDFGICKAKIKRSKQFSFTREDAYEYLLKNIFNKKDH